MQYLARMDASATAPIVIRRATDEDIHILARELAGLPLFTSYGLERAQLEARWSEGLARGEGFYAAFESGAPTGLCWYLKRGAFGTGAYLRTLAVVPRAQGHGVGVQLLRAFEEATADAPGGWFLLASDFNEGAHRFYVREGYTKIGELPKGFASPRCGEYIYWKRIVPASGAMNLLP